MATSVYFDKGTNNEQTLYEDLLIEQLKVFGHDVYYLPRTLIKEDTLFGEDVLSKFDDAYGIEMFMEQSNQYWGNSEQYKFLSSIDSITDNHLYLPL